jgi:hypothetical protein
MKFKTSFLAFPEGEIQETHNILKINQMVDINGYDISLPLKTERTIVYRVYKVSMKETKDEFQTYYYLEQVPPLELRGLVDNRNTFGNL